MNIRSNLIAALNNPHVSWPYLLAFGIKLALSILDIWLPGHKTEIAATRHALEPVTAALMGYATIAAANSAPTPPAASSDQQTPNPPKP